MSSIEPGQAPGTLWRRVTAGELVLAEGPMPRGSRLDDVGGVALDDARRALAARSEGAEIVLSIFDGDSGELVARLSDRGELWLAPQYRP